MIGIISKKGVTALTLADALGAEIWQKKTMMPFEPDVLIRWGCTRLAPEAEKVLNTAESINLASNKALCRKLLHKAGIAVPRPGTDRFPCIGRKAKHRAGKGLWYCENQADVDRAIKKGAKYFSEFYPKQTEYRVHIGGGKVILYSQKVGNTEGKISWNHKENEIVFEHLPREEWRPEIYRLAKQAIAEIGLDFGAVDILADAGEGHPVAVVCEINTAPALSPYGIKRYIRYFNRILEEEGYI